MRKLIAIAFSDCHLNNWSKFNLKGSRTDYSFLVLKHIFKFGIDHKIPILFSGDWIHTKESIDMELFIKSTEFYDKYSHELKLQVYAISGNHDLYKSNSFKKPSKSYITAMSIIYPWLRCVDFKTLDLGKFVIHGIPYLDNNIGIKEGIKSIKVTKGKKNILLLHTDYDGARDTDGRITGSVENLDRTLLRKFDLVLCGHIHKHQKLDKHVYMVGAPSQQRFTDEGNKMGYIEIYDDMKTRFVPLDGMPEFITVSSEDEIEEDNNYYRVIKQQDMVEENNKLKNIKRSLSKIKIAKKYLKIKGIKDAEKKAVLIKVLKEAEDD